MITFAIETPKVSFDLGNAIIEAKQYEDYEGSYEATPTWTRQTFETNEKVMQGDFAVKSIPIETVTNVQGGNTITIGG